jgi:beta-N-acetylhexosaminidase
VGLDQERTVSIERIGQVVGTPEHTEVADEIARKSITILTNGSNLLPLNGTRSASVLSITVRRGSDVLAGRYFNAMLRSAYPRLTTLDLETGADESDYENALRRARGQGLVVVGIHSSYAGSVGDREDAADFIEDLGRLGVPHVVVSFGNPYLIADFPETQAYVLAWNGSEASQRAAAGALLGDFDVLGRMPTRIPPIFALGDGITIPQRIEAAGGR